MGQNANRLAAAFAKKFEIKRGDLNWKATSINGVSNNCVFCVVNIFCHTDKSAEELSLETAFILTFFVNMIFDIFKRVCLNMCVEISVH